jgi:hypothetical protein
MVRIDKIISVTAGRFHCWVESPVGIIRKPNAAVPQDLWDIFEGRKEVPKIKVADIKRLPGGIKQCEMEKQNLSQALVECQFKRK